MMHISRRLNFVTTSGTRREAHRKEGGINSNVACPYDASAQRTRRIH
jgi:hypothetical protein